MLKKLGLSLAYFQDISLNVILSCTLCIEWNLLGIWLEFTWNPLGIWLESGWNLVGIWSEVGQNSLRIWSEVGWKLVRIPRIPSGPIGINGGL